MSIQTDKTFFLITLFVSAFFLTSAEFIHASIIESGPLPIQDNIVIDSQKDIPRLEWTAGRYLQKKQFQDAVELCKKILNHNQNSLKAKAYLAAAYKGLGDETLFKSQSAIFEKQHPESDELFLGLAWTYSALGDLKNAEATCKKGIKIVTKPESLIMELATILLKQNKIDEAKTEYKNVLKQKDIATKNFLNANFALCRIGLEQKDFKDVVKRAKMLTELYAPIPQSYKFLGDAYIGQKKFENAVNTYKKLIDANPKSELPYQEIPLIYNDKIKDTTKALSYAKKGVQKFSDNPKTMDIYGWILYSNQEYSKALQQFEAAIKISENNPWFYYHAGMACQKLEDKSNALKNYKKALDLLENKPAKEFKNQIKNLINQCEIK